MGFGTPVAGLVAIPPAPSTPPLVSGRPRDRCPLGLTSPPLISADFPLEGGGVTRDRGVFICRGRGSR